MLAEKYVYLFFDYLRAAYTQPINKTEFEQHLSIKDQSAALLLTLRTVQWQVVEALNSHRPTISDPAWVSRGTAAVSFKILHAVAKVGARKRRGGLAAEQSSSSRSPRLV